MFSLETKLLENDDACKNKNIINETNISLSPSMNPMFARLVISSHVVTTESV